MNKHSSHVRGVKHFLLGAGLALVVTFTASSVFAQSLAVPLQGGLIPCGSLGGKMVTGAECNAADKAQGIVVCATGQLPTPGANCIPGQQNFQQPGGQQLQFTPDPDEATSERDSIQYALASGRLKAGKMIGCKSAGGQQATAEDCLQAANDIIAGKTPSMPQNQQTPQSNFQNPFMPSNPQDLMQKAAQDATQMEKGIADGGMKLGQKMPFCQWNQDQPTLVEDCLRLAKDVAAGKTAPPSQPNFQNQQFNQQQNFQQPFQQNQQPLFGQQEFGQQQTQPRIITPTLRSSGTTLASKGLKLALKMQSSLNSTYKKAKGKTKKLAAVRSIAKKLPTLCRYITSGDDEADLDEGAFNCDVFVADLSEPIGEALQAKDYEVAYESTVAALESFGEVFNSLQ